MNHYFLVIIVILFVCYTLFNVIINYDGGSSNMTMIMRLVMLIVMVVIVIKFWATLTPLKNAMKHYENNPTTNKVSSVQINVGQEVDEILSNIEKNKEKKNGTEN